MRQPRAKIGQGGISPALGDKDPRNRRSQQPQVAEDIRRQRALQRIARLEQGASMEALRQTLNDVVQLLKDGG